MHMLAEYGYFLAKIITIVIAIIVVLLVVVAIGSKGKERAKEKLKVKKINDLIDAAEQQLNHAILSKSERKQSQKIAKKQGKAAKKQRKLHKRRRVFLLDFHGDIRASEVKTFRKAITSILTVANKDDEVVVRLESPGGLVHNYGLAASQLQRFREQQVPLTVCIDKVAASGGYLMACVANRIIAAPFAIIGSIGVITQAPNFHRLLKKNAIDFEQLTAGEYKRTLTYFGKNTEKGRRHAQQDIDAVLVMFKDFIRTHRPQVDIEKVATGEYWQAKRALALNLIDELCTSDQYLMQARKDVDIFHVSYHIRKTLPEKILTTTQLSIEKIVSQLTHFQPSKWLF